MKILFIGDIVGKPGRRAVRELLPKLVGDRQIDLVIANCEMPPPDSVLLEIL